MGLFKRGHRVAEGGAYATDDDPSSSTAGGGRGRSAHAKTTKPDDLGLFGADSDESDDDATIDRYANKDIDGGDHDDAATAEQESKKVSVLLSKMSPEELFHKYDTDGSGNISKPEFLAMLPDLGIRMSEAKAVRIFKKCDTDGTGEIDLNEFKMAMFAVDPVSGNSLGFAPSQLLAPRDAFELFDEDGTGQIDELEFADVLEYFGMEVSDGKQEAIFKKYDKDKSGFIDYNEFRSMWIRLSNVREELTKRGVEIPKYATPWKLQHLLEEVLDAEEAKEAQVMAEAKKFLDNQREKQRRQRLGHEAVVRAQDELAAALDAAGQVYVLGTGKYQQFASDVVVRNEELFPGFRAVSEIWGFRVDPKAPPPPSSIVAATATIEPVKENQPARDQHKPKKEPPPHMQQEAKRKGRYVRRRPENKRWTSHSPPKLNSQTMLSLKTQIKVAATHQERDGDSGDSDTEAPTEKPHVNVADDVVAVEPSLDADDDLAKRLLYEDREVVRSLRFQSTVIMKNTGSLWGRGVLCGALSDDVAFTVTSSGSVFTWGGKHKQVESVTMQRAAVLNDVEDDTAHAEDGDSNKETSGGPAAKESAVGLVDKVSPRSSMVKMTTKDQLNASSSGGGVLLEMRDEERVEAEQREKDEEKKYAQLKSVVLYFDVWEPPPSHATRMLFMEQVLLPKLDYDRMRQSASWRGLSKEVEKITKMELVLFLADCFELEKETQVEDSSGGRHEEIKAQEAVIQALDGAKDKKSNLQLETEKTKLLQMWDELRAIRKERSAKADEEKRVQEIQRLVRADTTYEALLARRHVQLEDLIPEFTARGVNARVEMSGITTRGPALHSPRGAAAVADVAVGGSHAAIRLQNGLLFTWGIGSNGRLGHYQTHAGQHTFDANHPQLLGDALTDTSIRQMACGYSHSAAVSSDGQLFTWGSAVSGKLGVGIVDDKYEQFSPEPLVVKFPGKRSIRFVSCGASHTGAVSTQGELFMWGSANGGRLGLGPQLKDAVVVPTLVKDLVTRRVRVWQVSCGNAHSACCTETTSELRGGSKKLLGGHVYVCGGAIQLGKYTPSWELVSKLSDQVAIKQVSCGVAHTAAVSAYGELYTWGRNANGCTGHTVDRTFIAEPELVRSLHVEPFNLALGKTCRQMNVYNEQGPELAVNGDVDGRLDKCIHTHLEEKPWWEVDLGQPAVIERIRVWNRSDEPSNPNKSRTEYTGRLYPLWIMVSEFAFQDLPGKEGLRAAKVQSTVFDQFDDNKRMTEWVLPTAQTTGQFVRIQLQGRNFLHLAEVEVFGVYSAFNYVGRVGAAHCGNEATLVVVPPVPQQSALDDYYLRAIQADADNATILRQFEGFESCFRHFGRGDARVLGSKCRLCRVFRECEICEFYNQANVARFRDEATGELPLRLVGDRMGLSDLVKLAVDDHGLEEEAQERERLAEQAKALALEVKQRAEQAAAEALAAAKKLMTPALLLKVLPGPMRKFTAAFPSRKGSDGKN